MKVMSKIKQFFLGKSANGKNIINHKPSFNTCVPNESVDFNRWAQELGVSSRVHMTRSIVLDKDKK